jgi:hypothetical protein
MSNNRLDRLIAVKVLLRVFCTELTWMPIHSFSRRKEIHHNIHAFTDNLGLYLRRFQPRLHDFSNYSNFCRDIT